MLYYDLNALRPGCAADVNYVYYMNQNLTVVKHYAGENPAPFWSFSAGCHGGAVGSRAAQPKTRLQKAQPCHPAYGAA
jgi:hypothetical protein